MADIPIPAHPSGDKSDAEKESESISLMQLEKNAAKNDHNRRESSKQWVHRGNVALIIVLYVLMISSVIILGYHWLAAESWHYLKDSQLDVIKTLIFSALSTSFAKDFIKNIS